MGAETHGKCGEFLRDMLPSARRVALIANAADPVFAKSFLEHARLPSSGSASEIGPIVTVSASSELDAAFETLVKARGDAVVFQASLPTKRIVELALEHRLPAATIIRAFAEIGGLMSYGSDGPALFRRTASFVHKILVGEKPANIPVEQATKFNLVVNLKTAKALGLTMPPAFLARADEVIE
jgi:putative ABC transport system substrate-binding protein